MIGRSDGSMRKPGRDDSAFGAVQRIRVAGIPGLILIVSLSVSACGGKSYPGCDIVSQAACDEPAWTTGVIGQDVSVYGEPIIRIAAADYRSTVAELPAPPPGSVYLVLDVATWSPVIGVTFGLDELAAEAEPVGKLPAVTLPETVALPLEQRTTVQLQGNLAFLVPSNAGTVTLRYTSSESRGIIWSLPAPAASTAPAGTRKLASASPTPIWTPLPAWLSREPQLPTPTPHPEATPLPWTMAQEGAVVLRDGLYVRLYASFLAAPVSTPAPPPGSTTLLLILELRAATAEVTYRADRFRAETAEGMPLKPVAVPLRHRLPGGDAVARLGGRVSGRLAFLVPSGTESVRVRYLDADGEGGIVWNLPGS